MFRLSYLTPAEIKGTIRVKKPIRSLGTIIDADGKYWDVGAIIGDTICAVPLSELHPYFTDTSGAYFGYVEQCWEPYKTKLVK